ncbi:MAG: putative membrane protein [Psychromonas sp.]|jgi:uncharacterized membrane protein
MSYEIVKVFHLLSVCIMVGATFCNGLMHSMVMKKGNPSSAVVILANIMDINRYLMAPSFAVIVMTGSYLVYLTGYSLASTWLWLSIALTVMLIFAFFIGYVLEAHLERLAVQEHKNNEAQLSDSYRKLFFRMMPIGSGATLAIIAIIYLMVAKTHQ